MPSRRLSPDTALTISLQAGAGRRLEEGRNMEAVVDALRREAGGRGDLLAHAAGSLLGSFLAEPTIARPNEVLAAAALLVAGADLAAAVARADHVRELRSGSTHTT